MSDALESLLRPSSVAVVGASDEPFVFSGAPIHNLRAHGFGGAVYPVNPRRTSVQGLACYPSVRDIAETVDTAVITVPASAVVPVLVDCEARGVRSATIVSSGFGEDAAGESGQQNAARLHEFLAGSKIRVIGPNTAGLLNLLDNYVPRAAVNHITGSTLRAGSVALITQSGACSNIVFNRAQAHGVGVGIMCATGDDEDLTAWQLVRHVLQDPRISTVMVITESMGDTEVIRQAAEDSHSLGKPIVHLRLGSSDLGQSVVMTHSGSIAGDAEVAKQAFRQWGIVDVDNFDELWQTALLFEKWGAPAEGASTLGIFAFSGGEAAMLADHASAKGLQLPPPSDNLSAAVSEQLAYAKAANPFDATGELVGNPQKLLPILDEFVKSEMFSESLVATPVYRKEAAQRILPQLRDRFGENADTPGRVVFSMWPAGEFTRDQHDLLIATGAPVIECSTAAVAAIARYQQFRRPVTRPRGIQEQTLTPGPLPASDLYFDARLTLETVGARFGPAKLVGSADEARAAASEIGLPVVMKANVPSATHKAAAGMVRIGVGSFDDVGATYEELVRNGAQAGAQGVVVEATVSGSLQAIVGARQDPNFGPVIVFGSGGSAADYLKDSATALGEALGEDDARQLLADTRIGSYLLAASPSLSASLVATICGLARWLNATPAIGEVDLNPVLVDTTRDSACCVDGRIICRQDLVSKENNECS